MGHLNQAEERFAAYLDAHGYHWQHEPDYQVELGLSAPLATTPDFLLERDGVRAVGEVRQFETTHIRDRLAKAGGHAMLSPREVYGTLRSGIFEKAQQLLPFAETGVPLLIVLANPLAADVNLDDHHVQVAMWGNPSVVIPIDPSVGGPAAGQDSFLKLEDYGVFAAPIMDDGDIVGWTNRHPHITAVVIVHERRLSMDWREEIMRRHRVEDDSMESATAAAVEGIKEIDAAVAAGEEPEGQYQWVSVYEVGGEGAKPLPMGWFTGPRDERFGHTVDGYGAVPAPSADDE